MEQVLVKWSKYQSGYLYPVTKQLGLSFGSTLWGRKWQFKWLGLCHPGRQLNWGLESWLFSGPAWHGRQVNREQIDGNFLSLFPSVSHMEILRVGDWLNKWYNPMTLFRKYVIIKEIFILPSEKERYKIVFIFCLKNCFSLRGRERVLECSHLLVHFSNAHILSAGPGWSWCWELNPGLLQGWQEPNCLRQHCHLQDLHWQRLMSGRDQGI